MWSNFPLFPERASTVAGDVDALYLFLVGISIFFSILITLLVVYFAIKYRRRSEYERPRPIEGSLKLEITWSVIPFILTMIMFVWGASVYFKLYRPPDDALEIYGTGKQWMWKFQHPEGHREINELHVPVGRPIKMTLTSQDVIHDFFVPVFRTKVDVIPGRYTTVWFQATKPGRYHLFCAEYCGTQHSGMIGQVIVMEPAQYQAWLSGSTGLPVSLEGGSTGGQGSTSSVTSGNVTTHGTTTFVAASGAGNSLASEGEKVFQGAGCIVCHKIGARGRGPDLAGLFGKSVQLQSGETVTADENYLRESIVNPQVKVVTGFPPIMAPYEGRLSEEEIIQLIAYIKSLK